MPREPGETGEGKGRMRHRWPEHIMAEVLGFMAAVWGFAVGWVAEWPVRQQSMGACPWLSREVLFDGTLSIWFCSKDSASCSWEQGVCSMQS